MKRNISVILMMLLVSFGLILASGASARAATFTVTNANDSGAGSLRQAILDANVSTEDDDIIFDATFFSVARTITLTSRSLSIDDGSVKSRSTTTIHGPGASLLTILGNNSRRVFSISDEGFAEINGVTITDGFASNSYGYESGFIGSGGAIINLGGLTLNDSVVQNSRATETGGGIFNRSLLTLNKSSVINNFARVNSGGIGVTSVMEGFISRVSLINSTMSGNTANQYGGGFFIELDEVLLISSTVSNNTAGIEGGGYYPRFSSVDIGLSNSIVADNSAPTAPNLKGNVRSAGFNLIENTAGANITGDTTGNIIGRDPRLGALQNNGGNGTPTRALLEGSPAIDQGRSGRTTDQRGLSRPVDDPNIQNPFGGDNSDIGAFEVQSQTFVVDTTSDTTLSNCRPAVDNDCSLRGAIARAAGSLTDDKIIFAPDLAYSTITLTNGELAIANNCVLTIEGLDANKITISANYQSRVFLINQNARAVINGVRIANGSGTGAQNSGLGGAIYVSPQAQLTLNDAIVSNSAATSIGGGIYNATATLTVNNLTVNNNSANSIGGIYNRSGIVTVNTSTVSNNSTNNFAGGLGNDIGGIFNLNNSTVSNNSAATGGGVSNSSDSIFNSRSSIIADNTATNAAPDFNGVINSQGYNFIESLGGTTLSGSATGNIYGQNPQLGALQENGGTTPNRALSASSLAIDKGIGSGADQRGFVRPYDDPSIANATGGNGADIGAFEALPSNCTFTLSPNSVTAATSGGNFSFNVTTQAGCVWRAVSNDLFITITGGGSGSGSGTVSFTVDPNGDVSRSGTISVAGQIFNVNQPSGCQIFPLPVSRQNVSATGGNFGFITNPSGATCAYTATSNASWITNVRVDGANISYTVASNPGVRRSGTITVAGDTFTVVQSALSTQALLVDNTGDDGNLSICDSSKPNDCSMRGAIIAANYDATDDSISFDPNVFASAQTIGLSRELKIEDNGRLTINGAPSNRVTISGDEADRVLNIDADGVTINGINITRGRAVLQGLGTGGALFNTGENVTLNDVLISQSVAEFGGGIYNLGTLTLNRSTVSRNLVASGNFGLGGSGGGIYNLGTLNLISTVSGNSATNSGGGISNNASDLSVAALNITNSTITGNRANSDEQNDGAGGGIFNTNPSGNNPVKLYNTIVANNTRKTNIGIILSSDIEGTGVPTAFNNLIGDAASSGGITNGVGNNIVGNNGSGRIDINTVLNTTLALNGGTTPNHALVTNSRAIDKAAAFNNPVTSQPITTDQRGLPRVFDNPSIQNVSGGNGSDIGSFESQCVTITINPATLPTGTVTVPYNQTFTASGGTAPYTFTVASGALPDGLTLNPNGTLSGTPTAVGTFNFTVAATDGSVSSCPGTSGEISLTITKADTRLSISAPNPTVFGQNYAVTASLLVVAPASGTPTGTISVTDGVNTCTITLPANNCSLPGNYIGTRNLTAAYSGSANYNASSTAPVAHTVNKANTVTTIISDAPDPSQIGENVTVRFAVAAQSPGAGTPTGSVTVSSGANSCTATIAAGQCVITFLASGTYSLTATYASDGFFSSSVSAAEPHTVGGRIEVTNTNGTGAGSLRQAIADALPGSTITFDPGVTGSINLGSALNINKNLTIQGPGANVLTLAGNSTSRTVNVSSGAIVTISGLTITNSEIVIVKGGAVWNEGNLTFFETVVKDSRAASGGGIFNNGNLTVERSTIANNFAYGNGGGIESSNSPTASLTIINSTISGNSASESGGGIYVPAGTFNLINATVTGNRAENDNNNSGTGGGIFTSASAIVTLKNNIIAGNFIRPDGNNPAANDIGGNNISDASYNLIGDSSSAGGIVHNTNGNIVGNDGAGTININAVIETAPNANGGKTPTYALAPNSPAIDKGSAVNLNFTDSVFAPLTTDQRGATRPFDNPTVPNASGGDGSDIGAFEAQAAPTAASISISGRVLTHDGNGLMNARVNLTDQSGNARTILSKKAGAFRFDDVNVGEVYVITISSRRYTFAPQVISPTENLSDVNFTAQQTMILQ